MRSDVIVVGAGLAGLACARRLLSEGLSFQIVEASNRVGGRVKTDLHEGFLLDHGFQVLLTAYPEAKRLLDYASLELRSFYPGAQVWTQKGFRRISDPWRCPFQATKELLSPVLSVRDGLAVARLRDRLRRCSVDQTFSGDEISTAQYLEKAGFSPQAVERFFRPFFGGVFLDNRLRTSSRMFEFVFKMMSEGDVSIPQAGMEMIPQQLAAPIPTELIRCAAPATRIESNQVTLQTGETLAARAVVLATDASTTERLLPRLARKAFWKGVTCIYFAASVPPFRQPLLVLNGGGSGPINNLTVPSNVSPAYAPEGMALISVSVLGTDPALDGQQLVASVRDQLLDWFGPVSRDWKHLKSYSIPRALPDQRAPALAQPRRPVSLADGIFVCGDHIDNASINGALESGRRAAEAVIQFLGTA